MRHEPPNAGGGGGGGVTEIAAGSESLWTDNFGGLSFPHGMAGRPDAVALTPLTGAGNPSSIALGPATPTATDIYATVFSPDGTVGNTEVQFYWIGIRN